MPVLVLMRHGESLWNFENRFTGGTDVPLTDTGRAEARRAGQLLCQHHITLDFAASSVLQRAAHTLEIVLSILGQATIPTDRTPMLNERYYGELQGMDKTEAARVYGTQQVHIWRRSYANGPPGGESLQDARLGCCPIFRTRLSPSSLRTRMF